MCLAVLLGTALPHAAGADDPPEITVGGRLFLDTRFAQFFAANAKDLNRELLKGDPVVGVTRTTTGTLDGPFKGQSMNCRACHLVDEHRDTGGAGMRAFARHSPIPGREDGKITALRNSRPR